MKTMKKKLMTLITSVMTLIMVFGSGITIYAMGDQSKDGRVPVAVTPGGVSIYGCYYVGNGSDFLSVHTVDFPVEYLLAIDAAGITNEMSDYEKCVRINDYLCAVAEYGRPEVSWTSVRYDGTVIMYGAEGVGLSLLQYGKGVCAGYSDAFQTMTSMLGMESYVYGSKSLNHGWNAVVIDGVTYFVDVTWNDYLNSNTYLMSTELWSDHSAADITIGGTSPCGWEIVQAEEQMKVQAKRAEEQAKMELQRQQQRQQNEPFDDLEMNMALAYMFGYDPWKLFEDEITELGLTVIPNENGHIVITPYGRKSQMFF